MVDIWLTIGILSYLCIYHLFVFAGRRNDLSNLAYSLLCFMYVFITLVIRVYPGMNFFNKHNFYFLTALSTSFIGAFLAFFAHTVFNLQKMKWYTVPCVILFAISDLIFGPLYLMYKNMLFIQILFLIQLSGATVFLILMTGLIMLKKQYRNRKRRIIIFGFLVLFLQGILFLVFEAFFSQAPPSLLSRLAILFMALMFSYALTDNFNREHEDLIELKNSLERKVSERTRQLNKAHRQKTNFFINLAHETKTPITLISNYLDAYIKKKGISPETEVIKRNIEKLLRDIVNILDMEKLETGITFYDHDQVVDLTGIIRQKVLFYKELAGKRKINITAAAEDKVAVRVDPYAMDRILNNLIDNALKYNRPGGSVEVRLKNKVLEDKTEISVRDTGTGINKRKLEHIFDPFYQISHEKKNYQGLGLGLSIVKRISDEIGAELNVLSEEGKGTEFKIWLNRYVPSKNQKVLKSVHVSKPVAAYEEVRPVSSERVAGRHNVLVVEDNPDMLAFLQDNIGRKYNVFGAVNGRQAWEMLENMPRPHLIVSDIMMDMMDGYDFCVNVKSRTLYKHIPFVFLTAKTSRYEQLKGLGSGAVDFITKPFSIDVLTAKIDSIIGNQERQKEAILNQIGEDLYRFLSVKANVAVADTMTGGTGGRRDEKTRGMSQSFSAPHTRHEKRNKYVKSDVLNKLETDYGISRREMEVIRLIKEGLLYKEIAAELDISMNTVETYRKRIFKKCNVKNKIELLKNL